MPLLPRFLEGHQERREHAQALERIVREVGGNVAEEKKRHTYTPADWRSLRGLPAVGPGCGGGAIPGTRPEAALMSRQPRE